MKILQAIKNMLFTGQVVQQETFISFGDDVAVANGNGIVFGKVGGLDVDNNEVYVKYLSGGMEFGAWYSALDVDSFDSVMMRMAA